MNRRALRIGEKTSRIGALVWRSTLSQFRASVFSIAVALGICHQVSGAPLDKAPSAEQLASETHAQRQFATNAYLADLQRAERVTYALAKAGAPYCPQQHKYSLGIPPLAKRDLPQDLQEGFGEAFQTESSNNFPMFLNIASDSPVGSAGVQQGDILVQLTDQATGKQVQPSWTLHRPPSTFVANEPIVVEIQRGASRGALKAFPQLVCDVQLQLLRTNSLVAKVDNGLVSLSQGILHFTSNDDELAYLIANELIHDQLRFSRLSRTKATAIKNQMPPSPADEQEADYLGAYLVVSAQFDIVRAQNVWRRIASIPFSPKNGFAARHPLPAMRGALIQAASNEIRLKATAGERQIPSRHFSLALANEDFQKAVVPIQESTTSKSSTIQEDPRLRLVTGIPFIDNEGIAGYQRFLDSPLRPRAFAIGPSKTSWRGAWSFRFGTNAAADALALCSTFARGPCYLYAVNDKVVWNAETALDQPQVNSAGVTTDLTGQPKGTGFADINDLTAVPLSKVQLAKYQAFLEKPSPRAFLITQGGQGFYWIGPTSTHDALAHCARLGTTCWLYAVNNEVVWSKDVDRRISLTTQLPTQNEESGFLEN